MLSIRTTEKLQLGYHIKDVLEFTAAMKRLQHFDGFENLRAGLANPTQIASTIFEIRVADWCLGRCISIGLAFGPEVIVKGRVKRPEFFWQTKLGNCFCECKKANFLQSAFNSRLSRMTQLLDRSYQRYDDWDPTLRLDVTFGKGSSNRVSREFDWVVDRAHAALRDPDPLAALTAAAHVTARLRQRTQPPPEAPDTMRQYLGKVGTVATEIRTAAYVSLTMETAGYRAQTAARLVRDARTQLPDDSTGLIFIEGVGHVAAMDKLRSLLTAPTYQSTPWVSVWSHDECLGAVWRDHQPFNGSVLA
jgi:hypothetical protein